MTTKRNLFFTIVLASIAISCNNSGSVEDAKKRIIELRKNQSSINAELKKLEAQVAKAEGKSLVTGKSVSVLTVVDTTFSKATEFQGDVRCEENIANTTDMGGIVTRILVTEGQSVGRGQVLATTDNSLILKGIEELRTQLDLANTVYEKQQRLWEQNIGSEIQFLQAKTNKAALERKLASTNQQLERSKIKAASSGVVDKIFLKVGEIAAPGMPAVRVVNLSEMKIEVDVPENYIGQFHAGQEVILFFPAINETRKAHVKAVGQVISDINRTFSVIVKIPNGDAKIKPNMMARIQLSSRTIPHALVIPARLIQQINEKDFVYIAKKNEKGLYLVHKADIVAGETANGLTVVTAGLAAGDQLIDAGYREVVEGDVVSF